MKKIVASILFVLTILTVSLLVECGGKDSTWLQLETLQGYTRVFRGRLVDGNSPIATTVEWWAKSPIFIDSICVTSDEWVFNETFWQPLSIIFKPESTLTGYEYYWVISWEDADGTEQKLTGD